MPTTNELREKFICFFKDRGHRAVPSDSLIPSGDPTLLFTSAGMVQFKKHFLGEVRLEFTRAASSQKCLRTSDIDQVGLTARHLTFFEMLGNFSFGDYFKKEAIGWGWEFLTKECGLDPARLYASVYREDEEAFNYWKKILPESRIVKLGEETNFWNMGPTGPCGPCSELLYDCGESFNPGHACPGPSCDCGRYLEVWNLVFTQFDRTQDGKLLPLPQKNIDTGMGLERLGVVANGLNAAFETDCFQNLFKEIGKTMGKYSLNEKNLRIISDHIRASTFLIADGILPSNEGRGYILRRLLRRALREAWTQGKKEPFLHRLVPRVAEDMKSSYPELLERQENIQSIVETEEKNTLEMIGLGTRTLEEEIKKVSEKAGAGPADGTKKIRLSGEKVFTIYDTFGLDKEIQKEIVRDWGGELIFSAEDYEKAREKATQVARKGWKGSGEKEITVYSKLQKQLGATPFKGYEQLELETKVIGILKRNGQSKTGTALEESPELKENEQGEIVLEQTPFYAESGGQVGDKGSIIAQSTEQRAENKEQNSKLHTLSSTLLAEVIDTQKPVEGLIVHSVKVLKGKVKTGDKVHAKVDETLRKHTMRHHTATHLLHSALRNVLGKQVTQAGSLVSPEKLRFDFTYPRSLTEEELLKIEKEVNAAITANFERKRNEYSLEEARKQNALAFFGEKYGLKVFVVNYGTASTEVCGGTHCAGTGEIGFFKVTSESSVGSGVRRIEAVAGEKAFDFVQSREKIVRSVAEKLKSGAEECAEKLEKLIQKQLELERENAGLKKKNFLSGHLGLEGRAKNLFPEKGPDGEVELLADLVDSNDPKLLRETADLLRGRLKRGIVLLASLQNDKISFVVALTKNCVERGFHAGEIAKAFALEIDGSGGGKEFFAQGGGKGKSREELKKVLDSFSRQVLSTLKD